MKKHFFLIFNQDYNYSDDSFLSKTKNLLLSLLFMCLFMILSLIIVLPLDYLIKDYFRFESILELISNTQSKFDKLFFIVIVVGPFVEELLFRLILKVNKLNLSVFVSVLSYKLIGGEFMKFNLEDKHSITFILLGLSIGIISYFVLNKSIIDFLNNKQRWLIVISIVLFGLIHLVNLKIYQWQLTMLYPFFVLPQLILGYFATNLRLKYGFIWGFFLHALLNGITCLF